VDTPPALHFDALKITIDAADFVVLPSPPAPMDLQALIETVQASIMPAKVKFRVLLTRVDPRSLGKALDAQQALMQGGIPAFNGFVRAYAVHEQAALDGIPITQVRSKVAREAEGDYRRIADELLREVKIDALTDLTRKLNRTKRVKGGERLTDNTLIRVAVDLLLSKASEFQGTTEDELRNSLNL